MPVHQACNAAFFTAAAHFFSALAAFPASVPQRAGKVAAWVGARLGSPIDEGECTMLLRTVGASDGVRQLCAALPPVDGMELITEHEQCVVCESALTTEAFRGNGRGDRYRQHCAPKVYASTGPVRVTLRPKHGAATRRVARCTTSSLSTIYCFPHSNFYPPRGPP